MEKHETMALGNKVVENANLREVDALTATGLIKHSIRDEVKEAFVEKYLGDFDKQKEGYTMPVLIDKDTGKLIHVWVKVSVTAKETFGRNTKKEEKVEVYDLKGIFD